MRVTPLLATFVSTTAFRLSSTARTMSKRGATSISGGSSSSGAKRAMASVDWVSSDAVIGGGGHTAGGQPLTGFPGGGDEPSWFEPERCRLLTSTAALPDGESVLYWMSREQRAEDNWALLNARELARQKGVPVVVAFNLATSYCDIANSRVYDFMLKGLAETEGALRTKGIPLTLLRGDAATTVPDFARSVGALAVFSDMCPLRGPAEATQGAVSALDGMGVPLVQVDAHNIVPVWTTSDKQEVGARTIRKRVHTHLNRFLGNMPPPLAPNDASLKIPAAAISSSSSASSSSSSSVAIGGAVDWDDVLASLKGIDTSVVPVDWCTPGATAGMAMVDEFIAERLKVYEGQRNDPNVAAISNLSPWLNFGQISAQRVIQTVKEKGKNQSSGVAGFVEEAVVRRELSDNFAFYNQNYDSLTAAAQWAQDSLELHTSDAREYVYSEDELATANTHDDLWNAAQIQLTTEAKLHGFLRMYWAKKILEWTPNPEEALRIAILFNDKYAIDGRDPNGYVGCMWSICGIHDMGWTERPIFGKIRFMNYNGCMRKFGVHEFVSKYDPARSNCIKAGGTPAPEKKKKAVKGKGPVRGKKK